MEKMIAMTNGVNHKMLSGEWNAANVLKALSRFLAHDWGVLPDEDRKLNDENLTTGYGIIGWYPMDDGEELMIVADRVINDSRTITLLLPIEY